MNQGIILDLKECKARPFTAHGTAQNLQSDAGAPPSTHLQVRDTSTRSQGQANSWHASQPGKTSMWFGEEIILGPTLMVRRGRSLSHKNLFDAFIGALACRHPCPSSPDVQPPYNFVRFQSQTNSHLLIYPRALNAIATENAALALTTQHSQ